MRPEDQPLSTLIGHVVDILHPLPIAFGHPVCSSMKRAAFVKSSFKMPNPVAYCKILSVLIGACAEVPFAETPSAEAPFAEVLLAEARA